MAYLLGGKKMLAIPAVMLLAGIVAVSCHGPKHAEKALSGEIEARQIDVASKIPARIDTFFVREGDSVTKGQIVARLQSPEVEARIQEAQSAVQAAKGLYDMAMNGARSEDIEAAKQSFEAAQAQFTLAEQTYQRMRSLRDKESISAQAYDEAQAHYDAARAQMNAARQLWNKAKKGARSEEIETARGNYERAQSTLAEVQALAAEIQVKAPQTGEIEKRVADPGEVIAAGYPILTMVDLNDIWATLYLTEDKMPGITLGKTVTADIPALAKKNVQFKVDFINPAGEFATKKAVMEQGGFDLKSFEIHLRPVEPVSGLRPGMSVRIHL